MSLLVTGKTQSRNRWLFLWPVGAMFVGALVLVNPFYSPEISLRQGIEGWLIALALGFVGWLHPLLARAGMFLMGWFFALPVFLEAPPLFRGWLMVCMLLPLIVASVPILAPTTTGFRARLVLLYSWGGTRELKRRPPSFDVGSLLQLVLGAAIVIAAVAIVKSVPASGFWLPVRWLAGGILMLAAAEMITALHYFLTALLGLTAPGLMESPSRSASLGEFWARRWNPATSLVFHRLCFEPLARCSPALGFFTVFIASAIAHALLFYMAGGRWGIALMNGAFFIVQPLFILAERQMNIGRWPMAARRAWTLVVLGITSPLFIEPALQLAQASFVQGSLLPPALFAVSLVLVIEGLFLLGAFMACSDPRNPKVPSRNPPANPRTAM